MCSGFSLFQRPLRGRLRAVDLDDVGRVPGHSLGHGVRQHHWQEEHAGLAGSVEMVQTCPPPQTRTFLLPFQAFLFSLSTMLVAGCSLGRSFLVFALFSARACATGLFQTIYVYTPEVFPTRLRAVAMGECVRIRKKTAQDRYRASHENTARFLWWCKFCLCLSSSVTSSRTYE